MSELLESTTAHCGADLILDLTATSWFALSKLNDRRRVIEPFESTNLVLKNYDLLEKIFSCFDPGLEWGSELMQPAETRETLFSVAKTCRSFLDPALDLLWREMCSLEPLLRLLPPLDGEKSLSVRPITPEDIQRFDAYARRVRYVRYDSLSPKISNYMFMTALRRHQYPILPFLQKLAVTSVQSTHMGSLRVLFLAISSSLCDVSLEDIKSSSSAENFATNLLYNILLKAPHVANLHLSGYISDKILDLVKDFRHLKLLSLGIKKQEIAGIFDVLSSLSALKRLSITSPAITEWPEPRIFSALQSLTLDCEVEEILNLLRVIEAPNLDTLSIDFDDPGPAKILASCIKQCAQFSQLLRSLILDLPEVQQDATWDILVPLGRCAQLRKLHITCQSISFSNDNLTVLCTQGGWRNLESFKFQIKAWNEDESALSLPALRILAEQCPRLTTLHISMLIPPEDGGIGEIEDEIINSIHFLEELHIYNHSSEGLEADTEVSISKYITRIFYDLKDLQIIPSW